MATTPKTYSASTSVVPPDSVLCPANGCWHPINDHAATVRSSKPPVLEGCRNRSLGGTRRCQCKRTPNQVVLAVIAGIS